MQRLLNLIDYSQSGLEKLSGKRAIDPENWLLDNGFSHHMTGTFDYLTNIADISPSPVNLPDGV